MFIYAEFEIINFLKKDAQNISWRYLITQHFLQFSCLYRDFSLVTEVPKMCQNPSGAPVVWRLPSGCFSPQLFDSASLEHVKTFKTERPVNSAAISPTLDHVSPDPAAFVSSPPPGIVLVTPARSLAVRWWWGAARRPWRSPRRPPGSASSRPGESREEPPPR